MLTREKLERLGVLMREARALEGELAALDAARSNAHMVADTAKGSSPQFPYTARVYTIVGQDRAEVQRITQKMKTRRRKLCKIKAAIESEYDALTAEIEAVPDSVVRQIMLFKYREGLTWDNVAARVGGSNSASAVRMAVIRYLAQEETCAQCADKV